MANEINISFRFDVIKGTYTPGAINISGLQIDQALMLEVGREISKEATAGSMTGNAAALKEMAEKHGGKITTLSGPVLEEFVKLDREKTEPELAKMVSPEILAAARKFVAENK
jgi:hypothetical protein